MLPTPEIVRAEMDYRLERALTSEALQQVREARTLRRPWWRRAFGQRRGRPAATVNQVRPAT